MNFYPKTNTKTNKHQIESEYIKTEQKILSNLLQKQQKYIAYNIHYNLRSQRKVICFQNIWCLVKKLNYSIDTFMLTVAIFDAVTARFKIPEKYLSSLSMMAFDLAAKTYESQMSYFDFVESDTVLPFFKDFDPTAKNNIVQVQKWILKFFEYEIKLPTVVNFIRVLISQCRDLKQFFSSQTTLNMKERKSSILIMIVINSTTNYDSKKFSPFGLACSIVVYLRSLLKLPDV